MLRLHNVGKRFSYFWLEHITFHLPAGYIMGLVGPNGSGKTTLIKVLLGLYEKTEGEINVFGYDITKEDKKIKDQIGFVLADHYFVEDWTMKKNALQFGKYYSRFRYEDFLKNCDKFQVAFALAVHPRLLILDEPTGNFDLEFREHMLHIMTKFVEDGTHSILLSTHITSELDQIADYITFLDRGNCFFLWRKRSYIIAINW